MVPIHDKKDREQIILNEDPVYKGFYKHPIFSIAANWNGEVINLINGKSLNKTIDPDGRCRIQFNFNGRHINIRLHRLLAVIFIGRPKRHLDKKFNELQVNHIDGNISNNNIDNLEWCTGKENTNHGFDNNLMTNNHPIFIKNVSTGLITKYRSINFAANYLNITNAALSKYLRQKLNFKYVYKGHIFATSLQELKNVEEKVSSEPQFTNGTIVFTPQTNDSYVFKSLKKAAEFVQFDYKLLFYHINKKKVYTTLLGFKIYDFKYFMSLK